MPSLFRIGCVLLGALAARADEGMWTFDNPPLKQWKERYGFEPTPAWLQHVRLASAILQDGGSGSFVSARGLVMTNHHVAAGQIAKLSTQQRNLTHDGFHARTEAEELKCPDLEINVLASFENVTSRVQGAVKANAPAKAANEQRKAEMAAIEQASTDATGLKSEVVTLYSGGEYWLYRYKKYTDVRLVFAPEEQIAFFGGDHDNFTYPRYNLDVAFLRVYESGQPAKTEHYFKWSARGPADGEFVVVSGMPAATNRLLTVAQLQYQRDVGNPLQMQVWSSRRDALKRFAATGPEAARRANATLRSLENSIKRLESQQAGLLNPRLMGRKEADENALRSAISARSAWQEAYGSAWDQVAAAYAGWPKVAPRVAFATLAPSRLGTIASTLVRHAAEAAKPNDQRYPEYRETRLAALQQTLFSAAPIYRDLEQAALTAWLEEAQKTLGANDPLVRAALQGATPAEVAQRAVAGTKLDDVAVRRALFAGGAEAIAKSDDPILALARRIEPVYRELRAWEEANIQSVDTSSGQRIAEARFAIYGKTMHPDATRTLRLSYGRVLGYDEDTTLVPYKTTFFGLYERAAAFDEKAPFDLPVRYRDARKTFDLSTPMNFVYTADTIGGNSGSPIVNRNAEIVGLNFDSNIQKLPNRYIYVDEAEGGRAVAVHSQAILEALRSLYGAEALAKEIAP